MSLLKTLLHKHKEILTAEQVDALAEHCRRHDTMKAFAHPTEMTTLEAASAFISFEREFCEQPVHLFGQDVPSLAHTIVRVFRARQGQDAHTMEPGSEILSARISEKSFAECMLSTDQGHNAAPMTVTKLGDFNLPPRSRTQADVHRAIETRQEEREKALERRMNELREQLGPEVTKTSAALREAVKGLQYNTRDVMCGSFEVTRHMENMSQVRNQILTEAAYAALHADKVTAALKSSAALLPPPEPVNWDATAAQHPMVQLMLDPVSDDLREAIRRIVLSEMKEYAERHPNIWGRITEIEGVEYIRIGSGQELSAMLSFVPELDEDKARIDRIGQLWNHAFNPHIAEDRAKYAADQASIGLSRRQGNTNHIHSSLPPSEQDYFSISISGAYINDEMGNARIRSRHAPILDLEIVGQDLMTALRGHPMGRPIPCSIRHICGHAVDRVDRPIMPITAEIQDVDKNIQLSVEASKIEEALQKVLDLANAKRSGKAWRKELDEALADFEDAMCALTARAEQEVEAGRNRVNLHTVETAKAMLSEISESLPDGTLKVLGLPDL